MLSVDNFGNCTVNNFHSVHWTVYNSRHTHCSDSFVSCMQRELSTIVGIVTFYYKFVYQFVLRVNFYTVCG